MGARRRGVSPHVTGLVAAALVVAAVLKQAGGSDAAAVGLPPAEASRTRVASAVGVPALLNVDFGAPTTDKVGPAAVGEGEQDRWNAAGPGFQPDYTVEDLVWADGTRSGVTMRVENLPGNWGMASAADPMFRAYSYSWWGERAAITLVGLPAGTYDFHVYANADHSGRGEGPSDNTGASVEVAAPGQEVRSTDLRYTGEGDAWRDTGWVHGMQLVVHPGVEVSAGETARIVLHHGVQGTGNSGILVNGLQVVRR